MRRLLLAPRDRWFARHRIVYLLAPRDADALGRLADAHRRLVATGALGVFGTAWPPAGGAARLRRPADSVAVLDAMDDAALIRAACARRTGLATSLTIAGDRAALLVEHGVCDGTEALAALAALLAVAAAAEVPEPAPTLRLPMVTAARAAGIGAFRSWWRQRDAPRADPAPVPPGTHRRSGRSEVVQVRLGADDLRALRRRPAEGRATLGSRLTALAAELLIAVRTGEADPRVVLPVDLRHLVSGRVRGNFIASEAPGSLLGVDWDPGAVNRRLAAQREVGLPLLVVGSLRALRRPRRRGPAEYLVAISVQDTGRMPVGEPLPASVTVAPWPSPTIVTVLHDGRTASLTVWDDSGLFDLDRVAAALEDLLAPFRADPGRR